STFFYILPFLFLVLLIFLTTMVWIFHRTFSLGYVFQLHPVLIFEVFLLPALKLHQLFQLMTIEILYYLVWKEFLHLFSSNLLFQSCIDKHIVDFQLAYQILY